MNKQEFDQKLAGQLGLKNPMSLPKFTKVMVAVSLKEAVTDKTIIEKVGSQLSAITGQKPKTTRAKQSIANFKVREGDPVGLVVTLRSVKMWDFLNRLINLALPRVRDFHGVSNTGFDGRGNYNLGLTEQIVFPEIEYSKIDRIRGLQITIVTNSGSNEVARKMLVLLGMPFEK